MDTLQSTFDGYLTRKISGLYYLYDTSNMKEMKTELQDLRTEVSKITESNGHAAQPLFPHEDGDRRNFTTADIVEMQTELQDLKTKINKITESLNTEIERIDAHDSRLDDNETNIDDVFDDFDVTDHCNLSELISGYINEDEIARNVANELRIVTK